MTATGMHRGHVIWFDETAQLWRYEADGLPVKDLWKERACGKCGATFTEDGHDPCIANLPGVMNACCGHGSDGEAYVQFRGGVTLRGPAALAVFAEHTGGRGR